MIQTSKMTNGRKVAIVGIGSTKFGEFWGTSLRELVAEAGFSAAEDAGIHGKDLEMILFGNISGGMFVGQEHVAALVADFLGLNPIPAVRTEAACASGGGRPSSRIPRRSLWNV